MATNAAYVTLLTKTEYLAGALVLYQSLLDVGTKYPLVVMVTPPVQKSVRTVLEKRRITLVDVESLLPKAGSHLLANHDIRFQDTWTKLRYVVTRRSNACPYHLLDHLDLSSTRYVKTLNAPAHTKTFATKRIVMLDSDMIVMRNMDELMDLELPKDWIAAAHACTCNPRRLPHYPADW
jgi:alpha-N-acetylglucosamine transferase